MYKNEVLRAVKGITECDGGYTGCLRTIRSLHGAVRRGNVYYDYLNALLLGHISRHVVVLRWCGEHGT